MKKYLSILVEGAGKQFLAKFGIEILPDSNRVDILEFPLPQIQAAGFETKQGVVDTITTKADVCFRCLGTQSHRFRVFSWRKPSR